MKVLFLDIDGVLQAHNSGGRHEIDDKLLRSKLSNAFKIDYTIYHPADVAACYIDWDFDAVNRIKNILDKTGAKIVVSSDWRERFKPNKMPDFLALWGLGDYWVGDTLDTAYGEDKEAHKELEIIDRKLKSKYNTEYMTWRVVEIYHYLKTHKEVTNFIIVDDMNLVPEFNSHCVKTRNLINDEQMNLAIELLNSDTSKVHTEFLDELDKY